MTNTFVAVLMGSDSDLPTMQSTLDTLGALGIVWAVKILLTIGRRMPRGNMLCKPNRAPAKYSSAPLAWPHIWRARWLPPPCAR